MAPTNSLPGAALLAPSPAGTNYDMMYYLKGAAAGGICCSITHGALCPVDVVKTRVQLDPVKVRGFQVFVVVCFVLCGHYERSVVIEWVWVVRRFYNLQGLA